MSRLAAFIHYIGVREVFHDVSGDHPYSSVTVLFCGSGGATVPAPDNSARTSAPQTPTIIGNWQFTAASTFPGKAPLTFSGSISRIGPAVSDALHAAGSNCFDRLTTMS